MMASAPAKCGGARDSVSNADGSANDSSLFTIDLESRFRGNKEYGAVEVVAGLVC